MADGTSNCSAVELMRLIRDQRQYPVHRQVFTPGLPDMLVHETIPRGQYVSMEPKICEGICGGSFYRFVGSDRRRCYDCMLKMPAPTNVRQRPTKRGYERKPYGA